METEEDIFEDDDEFEDDEPDLRDEIAALHEQVEINQQLSNFQQRLGVPLDPETSQQLGEMLAAGYDIDEAAQEVFAEPFESDFDRSLDALERQQGRTLADAEVQELYNHAVEAGSVDDLPQDKLLNLDTPAGRSEYMNERFKDDDAAHPAETVAPLTEDSTSEERAAYASARFDGAQIEPTTDQEE